MHDQPRRAGEDAERGSTAERDDRDQRVVLIQVLTLHPTHLRLPELVREITAGAEELSEGDRYERAVRELTGAGLLHCPDGLVMPTRAAIRLDELLHED